MNARRTLLLASVAAGGLLVAFASGAVALSVARSQAADDRGAERHARLAEHRDGGEHGRHHKRKAEREDGDRRAGGEHDEDHEDDEGDEGRGGRSSPAAAGSTAPVDNGLIRKGSAPKVRVN